MRKLLSADLYRLLKSRIFLTELIFTAVFSLYILFANYSLEIQASEHPCHLEAPFFIMHQLFCIVFATAISLSVGTEYSDGTLRNKLISGHTRSDIYFSVLLTNLFSSLLMFAVHCAVSLSVGYFLFGSLNVPFSRFSAALLCAVLANLFFATVFVAIALCCSNKPVTVVASLLFAIGIMWVSALLYNKLNAPETVPGGIIITENGYTIGDPVKNPNYVSGFKRNVYEVICSLLPFCHLLKIQTLNTDNVQYLSLISLLLLAAATLGGYIIFRKKDIK